MIFEINYLDGKDSSIVSYWMDKLSVFRNSIHQ